MNHKSLGLHQLAQTHIQQSTNHLPVEIKEMCLHIFAQDAKQTEYSYRGRAKQIGPLRLACRHFRDVLSPELFGDLTFSVPPFPRNRLEAFLRLVKLNPDVLKHICNVEIDFSLPPDDYETNPHTEYIPFLAAISKASITTLKISGLDEEFPLPILYDSLDALRCNPKLQRLIVSGTAVPSFLVCGHLGSTRLRALKIEGGSSPEHGVNADNGFDPIPFDADSILVSTFQPFAELETLDVANPTDLPDYFPLHDFGWPYYPSNHRIPVTLPALSTLGSHRWPEAFTSLTTLDYKILGSLLSRASELQKLSIQDDFPRSNGIDDFAPLVQELPTLKRLKYLELSNPNEGAGKQTLFTMCDIIAASLPLPALETLSIRLRWTSVHPDATRATLYLSKCWKKLEELLLNPGLKALRQLKLCIEILSTSYDMFDITSREPICPGEIRGLQEALVNIYSLGGKRQVEVVVF